MKENTAFARYCRPLTAHLLEALKLDKIYHRASGNYLFYYDENKTEQKVHDFVGGYGANIIGHNNPEIISLVTECMTNQVPVHTQMSDRSKAGELGRLLNEELNQKTGEDFIFTFASTGTEAAEAAIKHALLSYSLRVNDFLDEFEKEAANIKANLTKSKNVKNFILGDNSFNNINEYIDFIKGKNKKIIEENLPKFLALNKAFHGKTTGSLSLTSRKEYRLPFLGEDTNTKFLPVDADVFKNELEAGKFELCFPKLSFFDVVDISKISFNKYVAVFVEPIQGEGGVNVIPFDFLKSLRNLTNKYKVDLIFDEIQCGFFRTGELMASFESGVVPDYYLSGKSLGGSFAKISALIIRKSKYQEVFGLLHTSTFAEDDLSSIVAMKSFEIAKSLSFEIKEKGKYLRKKLTELKEKYPSVIADVRGVGLMTGIEFKNYKYCSGYGLQVLSRSGYLGYVISGYLLNTFNIRIAAVLSADFTVRIQPSALVTESEIDLLANALEKLCEILDKQDLYKLLEFLLEDKFNGFRTEPQNFRNVNVEIEDVSENAPRVGFLIHYINAEQITISDPSFTGLDNTERERLLSSLIDVATPTILGRKNITDIHGNVVSATFVGLPFTSGMCRNAMVKNETAEYIRLCNDGVKMLVNDYDVSIIGLGQFTSVVSNNGKYISNSDVAITTGNSLTVFMGLEAMKKTAIELNINIEESVVGIVGAAGNISSVYAQCLSDECKKIILFGSQSEAGYQKALRTARLIYADAFKNILENKSVPKGNLEKVLFETSVFEMIKSNPKLISDTKIFTQVENELGKNAPIEVSRKLDRLKECKIVVSATNASEPFLTPDHFQKDTVICDISVPVNCTEELIINDKNIRVILGGVVALPHGEKIPVLGYPLESGSAFACISETLLLGLENYKNSYSYGLITKKQVCEIGAIADKHGFKLGSTKKDFLF